ncbi:MAG: type II secretion protein F [Archaeoglobus sp.]|nr:MAG: type II secretion protein F [Archaeoglobus sp.]
MFESLRHCGLKPERYFKFVFAPLSGAALIVLMLIVLFSVQIFRLLGLFAVLLYFVPLFLILIALLYPKIIIGRMRNQIDNNIHFYITHMGALATSDIDRKEMMEIISGRKEYKALAEETRKIFLLMDKWNRNLSQACRFIARRTPSKIFSEFLDRMAHELDSGEDFKEFIKREQKTVMNAFATNYQGKLYSIDVFKEVYTSIIISLSFFAAFAIIMPFLTGISVTFMLDVIVVIFTIVELGVLVYLKSVAPDDPIWQTSGETIAVDWKIYKYFYISMIACLILFTVLLLANYVYRIVSLPVPFIVAITVTPLAIPGYISRKEESIVKDKDKNSPSFIMSLGASASARGGDILESLKFLTAHDFGSLTNDVRKLYKRLKSRINKKRAWEKFSIETGSNLIYRFTDMFVEAIGLGSDPKDVAEIIADNFTVINTLRAKRAQTSSSFVGIAYGVVIGIAFSLYISFGVVESMNSLYSKLHIPNSFVGNILHTVPSTSIATLNVIIFLILLIHAIISSISLKVMDGGRYMSSLLHLTGMTWVAAFAGYISRTVMIHMLGINF